ncbi:MAG: hypothetical protein Q9218_003671 [Villophora microphyllina]
MSCPSCFTGTIHDGHPTGTETVVHGLHTYIASPPQPSTSPSSSAPSPSTSSPSKPVKAVVVIVPDAIGWKFTNTRCLADEMAKAGNYTVYIPDVMDGNGAPQTTVPLFDAMLHSTGLLSTLLKPYYLLRAFMTIIPFQIRNRFSITWPRVEGFVRAVRKNEARDMPLGVAGYCWGGRHATVLASLAYTTAADENGRRGGEKGLVDAAFTAHPGGISLPSDIEKLRAPWSMAIGDDDFVMSMSEVNKIKEIVARSEEMEQRNEVVVYSGAKHGFAVRGNPGDERDKKRGEEAREQCLSWFQRWFAKVEDGAGE